jgi:hypothetical protein
MTGRELAAMIGQNATYRVGAMTVSVSVMDARTRFGNLDLLISPDAGTGEQWVQSDSVTMVTP